MTDWSKPKQRENDLQPQIMEYAHRRGWFCEKIESRSGRGFMDLFCLRNGLVVLIEVKVEGEEPRPQQEKRARDIRSHGGVCYAVDSLEQARSILR